MRVFWVYVLVKAPSHIARRAVFTGVGKVAGRLARPLAIGGDPI